MIKNQNTAAARQLTRRVPEIFVIFSLDWFSFVLFSFPFFFLSQSLTRDDWECSLTFELKNPPRLPPFSLVQIPETKSEILWILILIKS